MKIGVWITPCAVVRTPALAEDPRAVWLSSNIKEGKNSV